MKATTKIVILITDLGLTFDKKNEEVFKASSFSFL